MKRNKLFILGICTVMVALVSLSLVSGTWAKYTSTVSGEDSARVAKWAFTVNGDAITNAADESHPQEITFDLFNTVKDTDGSDESDVENGLGDGQTVIAPGTQGSFTLEFANNSEVNAEYTVHFDITKSDATLPIEFSINNAHWTANIADIVAAIEMHDGEASHTIYWRWAFTGDDAVDTSLGLATTLPTVTVKATVTFVQVD